MTICRFISGYMILFKIEKVFHFPRPMARQDSPIGDFERLILKRNKEKKEETAKYFKDHPELIDLQKGLKEIEKKYL